MKDQQEKDERRELDDKYFQRFDDLNEARPIFKGIDEAFLCFAQNILSDYKAERLLLEKRLRIDEVRENYKLDLTSSKLLPRTWRNWKKFFRLEQNFAADLLDKEVELDTQQVFEGYLKRLSAQKNRGESEAAQSPEPPKERAEEPPENVQSSAPVTRVEVQQLITVYVAGFIPPSVIELEAGDTQEIAESTEETPEDDQSGDVETEVEEFDDYGIDTEYEIVDDEEAPETPEEEDSEAEEEADEPENELVPGETTEEAEAPEPGADEPSEGIQNEEEEETE